MKVDMSKCLVLLVNTAYMMCGVCLVLGGAYLLSDTERVLLSRLVYNAVPLHQPLFYYVALALMIIGLLVLALSVFGCYAVQVENSCLVALYLFILLVVLLAESVFGILTAICPEYMGLKTENEDVTDQWQRNYGVPGREQYTAAIDLAQTKFECCGINSGKDFMTSWWRLRELAAPNLLVPLSCCHPDPKNPDQSFLDPQPLNETLCQDKQPDNYILARYTEGCLEPLVLWLRHQTSLLLLAGLIKLSIQLLLLFVIILSCTRQSSK
ncbi:tetraspanin-11-like [Diaphorina citri]|uniref:Tetraspanin n=1 Tax=Diaphorina citri TaxID=121845 RepID=A0A3Q0JH04_DIACI|nr:tetraspanin-11-like [Diaphorina citri]